LILSERAWSARFVARFPGGQVLNRDHKGDPDARTPIQMVPAAKQREALEFVCENVFGEDAFKIDPELLNHMAPGRLAHWDSDEFDFRVEFNIHDLVEAIQFRCLVTLMNPFTIGRVHDNEVKFGEDEDVYTLAEHLGTLTKEIWSELDDPDRAGSARKPFINSFRRNLQRDFVRILGRMVLSDPGGLVPADANAIARWQVSGLSKKIGKVLEKAELDEASEAHLRDVKMRIDKTLEADFAADRYKDGGWTVRMRQPPSGEKGSVPVLPAE
jgi:hypothetical protein